MEGCLLSELVKHISQASVPQWIRDAVERDKDLITAKLLAGEKYEIRTPDDKHLVIWPSEFSEANMSWDEPF